MIELTLGIALLFAVLFANSAYRDLLAEIRQCRQETQTLHAAMAEHGRLVRKTIAHLDPNDPDAE